MAEELSGKQRRHLRALGHHLDPVLQIGHEGVSDAVVEQANAQLEAHELIKVRVSENAPDDRRSSAAALAERCNAHLAQVLGRTALLYRRRQEQPEIVLPKR
ncbi:MAG: ribosome assembly RNA-binding protein YhbY [Myxococcales bacterium]|nr:ribosome assembly RNA-binding protein YhbY [Myxococcales bacterium]